MTYDPQEQEDIATNFNELLRSVTQDGGRKRSAGSKPSWKVDTSHPRAIFSHLGKWVCGERVDADSGVHPLIHCAWRCLAQAWQEMNGVVDTQKGG